MKVIISAAVLKVILKKNILNLKNKSKFSETLVQLLWKFSIKNIFRVYNFSFHNHY